MSRAGSDQGAPSDDARPAESGGRSQPVVEIRRSARRRRSVAAYRDGGTVVILMPARLTAAEEQHWVETMLARLERSERRKRPSDEALLARARVLDTTYLGGESPPASVRWVENQSTRWGSCTPSDRSIRLSHRLQGMPSWVVDYVLVHELAHLQVEGHDERFWELVGRFPRCERARGFLEGVARAADLPWVHEDDVNDVDELAD